jgi:predicted metal-dependent HD superfamily phosphohydrolase
MSFIPEVQECTTRSLIETAVDLVDQKYGSESRSRLSYHDATHTLEVVNAIGQISFLALSNGRIDLADIPRLSIAGAFHDVEQGLGSGANEEASADIAVDAMRETGHFSDEDFDIVHACIIGTKVTFEGDVMTQHASSSSIYQVRLLADADLVSFGSEYSKYQERALGLFEEIYPTNNREQNWLQFLNLQVALLSTHEYNTEEARVLFTNQQANLEMVIVELENTKYKK